MNHVRKLQEIDSILVSFNFSEVTSLIKICLAAIKLFTCVEKSLITWFKCHNALLEVAAADAAKTRVKLDCQ